MASLLAEIETTISEGSYKAWYFNEFFDIIDKENIESDYHLVYKSFTRCGFMSRPYDFPDMGVWNWLIDEGIIEYDIYQNNDVICEKDENPPFRDPDYLYCFTTRFFNDYQKYHNHKGFNIDDYWFKYKYVDLKPKTTAKDISWLYKYVSDKLVLNF